MANISIPEAALEAGVKAFAEAEANDYTSRDEDLAAAALAILKEWPGMIHGKYFAEPSIILPLTEKTDDKA